MLAAVAGLAVGVHWRYAYLISILPALLVLWVWSSVQEPESWTIARDKAVSGSGGKLGSFRELFFHRVWGPRAVLGMMLAAVGLGTFWSVTVAGQDLMLDLLLRQRRAAPRRPRQVRLRHRGDRRHGLGILSFGPICVRLGPAPRSS